MDSNSIKRPTVSHLFFPIVICFFIALILPSCGGGGTTPEEAPPEQKQLDADQTTGQAGAGDVRIISTYETEGVLLDNDSFDLLMTLDNPLSTTGWDLVFGGHSGQSVERTAAFDYLDPDTECLWEITIAFTYRQNPSPPDLVDEDLGDYKYWRTVSGPVHSAYVAAPKAAVSVNCFDGPWDRTEAGYGIAIIEYRVAYRLQAGYPGCELDLTAEVDAEAYYKSTQWSRTWVGFWSPLCTRIANAYSVDHAQSIFNGTTLFDQSAGAQSGDDVSVTIDVSLGGDFGGASGSVSIGSSETRNKDEGTSEDFLNAFGKSSSGGLSGYIFVNSGGKVFARHDGRAGARSHLMVTSVGIYLWVNLPDIGYSAPYYYLHGHNAAQRAQDLENLVQPFFEARGFADTPPSG